MYLKLQNWRLFEEAVIKWPEGSFSIVDINGSGKTSLLSAYYTLQTGKDWPGTKLVNQIRQGSNYLSIAETESDEEFYFASTLNPITNRFSKKYITPASYSSDRSLVITYQPDDNLWLNLGREAKLNKLDNLIFYLNGDTFRQSLILLKKYTIAKRSFLKKYLKTAQSAGINTAKVTDMLLEDPFWQVVSQKIFYFSKIVWQARLNFFSFIQTSISEYLSWGNLNTSYNFNWQLGRQANKPEHDIYDTKLEKILLNLEKTTKEEVLLGKVVFTATRDDFSLNFNSMSAENFLSRGQMRLFILFIRHLISIQPVFKNTHIVWLADDVFHELDSAREKLVSDKILALGQRLIATSTKNLNINIDQKNIASLVNL